MWQMHVLRLTLFELCSISLTVDYETYKKLESHIMVACTTCLTFISFQIIAIYNRTTEQKIFINIDTVVFIRSLGPD